MSAPIRVAVTGAAGNIGYSLLWRIASGDCFGKDQPLILQLLEIPPGMERLKGVMGELVHTILLQQAEREVEFMASQVTPVEVDRYLGNF